MFPPSVPSYSWCIDLFHSCINCLGLHIRSFSNHQMSFRAKVSGHYRPGRRIPRLSEQYGQWFDWNDMKSVILGHWLCVGGLTYTINTCSWIRRVFLSCFEQSSCLQICCHHWRNHLFLLFKNVIVAATISSFKTRSINQFKGNHRELKYLESQSDAPGRC